MQRIALISTAAIALAVLATFASSASAAAGTGQTAKSPRLVFQGGTECEQRQVVKALQVSYRQASTEVT